MPRDEADTPIQFIRGQGKLRNGLFLRGAALYEDRIVFEVFASRALHVEDDLADLRFTDDVGTKYEMVPPESGAIEGKALIEFRPAVPAGWSHLHLSQRGWGHHVVRRPACSPTSRMTGSGA
jgi:hypothetical protein